MQDPRTLPPPKISYRPTRESKPVESIGLPPDVEDEIRQVYAANPDEGEQLFDAILSNPDSGKYRAQLESMRRVLKGEAMLGGGGRGGPVPGAEDIAPITTPSDIQAIVPAVVGIGAATAGIVPRLGMKAAPPIMAGLDYLIGAAGGRAATGQNPVSREALAEIPAVMGGPLGASLGGSVVGRTALAGLGGMMGAQGSEMVRSGQPAGALETGFGGVAGAGGNLMDELAMALKPGQIDLDRLAALEAKYPFLRGKLSSVFGGPPQPQLPANITPQQAVQAAPSIPVPGQESPRMSALSHLEREPFVVNPAVKEQERALGEEIFRQTSAKMPAPSAEALEQIAKQVESGRISREVVESKNFQQVAQGALNKQREAISDAYGAVLEPMRADTTVLDATDLANGIKELQTRFGGEVVTPPSSPVAERILAIANKPGAPGLSVSDAVQMIQDLKPKGGRVQSKFNEETRDLLMDFIQKNASNLPPDTQTAIKQFPDVRAQYRKYAQNRDLFEPKVETGQMQPQETWGGMLREPPDVSQSPREVMSYFGADPEFQAISARLNASPNVPKILDKGFKSGDDLIASAVDLNNPERSNRAWSVLRSVTKNPKELETIGAKMHDKMLYPSMNKDTGAPQIDIYKFMNSFNSLPDDMAKNIYGANHANVKQFVRDIEPYVGNIREMRATPQAESSAVRVRGSFHSFVNSVLVNPAGKALGVGVGLVQPAIGVTMLLGPSVLGKMILTDHKAAFNLLQAAARAWAAQNPGAEAPNRPVGRGSE